jgi:capsular exopolysaccharide synthesis family protein
MRRWYWLLALGVIVALFATHLALAKRVPLYRSTATVRIGGALQSSAPSQSDLSVTDRLVAAYAELATRNLILTPTITELNLPFTPDDLRARVVTTQLSSAQAIDIHVVDEDPNRAAMIANEIARQLVLQTPKSDDADSQSFIRDQLVDLQQKITTGQSQIVALQDQIATLTSAADVADAQQRLTTLQAQVDTWQQSYAKLVSASGPSPTNLVQIISPATPATAPIPSSTVMYYGLAAVLGGGLAALLGLGLGLLNTVVAETKDLRDLDGETTVLPIPRYRMPSKMTPVALSQPNSPATAAYRVLRNSLQISGLERNHFTLVVTSSRSGEGKTTTTANLGVTLANSGRKIVLVDANFRNPELGHLFGLDSYVGLSDLMLGDRTLGQVMRSTVHPNLMVIPSGTIPANYLDLLSSRVIEQVVRDVAAEADVVLFDTPALSEEQESLLLAKAVSGVLVVAESRHVRADDLQRSLGLLRRAEAPVVGVVLNKARARRISRESMPWSREARLRARAAHWRSEASAPRGQGSEPEQTTSAAD